MRPKYYRIKKGRHRSWPPVIGLHWNKKVFREWILFDESCKYLPTQEREINKLYGFGYVNGGHHKDSARFGWRYSPELERIEIFSYCYVDGKRIFKLLANDIRLNLFTQFEISIEGSVYKFRVRGVEHAEPFNHKKKLQYPLGFYFGGDSSAPHNMQISK